MIRKGWPNVKIVLLLAMVQLLRRQPAKKVWLTPSSASHSISRKSDRR